MAAEQILENNCMQTLCSAGATTVAVAVMPAFALAQGQNMAWYQALPYTLLVGELARPRRFCGLACSGSAAQPCAV
jgi:uncharacterized oligopeptide transporter (OPT) family protein